MTDLSIIIPARNEEFLQRTVDDILLHSEADTEVIVLEDGTSTFPPVTNGNGRVRVINHTEPTGQRASTNEGVRLSNAKYVMKADGHCAFDQGFDKKLMADCEYDWTIVPRMHNLHVFNLVCKSCGKTWYQAKTPAECDVCHSKDIQREYVWKPKKGTQTSQMRFDSNLQFQYWKDRQRKFKTEELIESMSFIGACWFMHRDRYLELEMLDENHGFWGQVGTEVSCRTWLSGGKLIVNRKTWFSHLFRTQFGWPYHITQGMIDTARAYSRDYWFNNRWKGQKYPLKWLVDRFSPVPGWEGFNWNGN